jgi:hypothetical protein
MPLNTAGTLRNRDSCHEKEIGQYDRLIIRTVQEAQHCVVLIELLSQDMPYNVCWHYKLCIQTTIKSISLTCIYCTVQHEQPCDATLLHLGYTHTFSSNDVNSHLIF